MDNNTSDLYSNINLSLIDYLLLRPNPTYSEKGYLVDQKISEKINNKYRKNFKKTEKNLGFGYFYMPIKKSVNNFSPNKKLKQLKYNDQIINISDDEKKNNKDAIDLISKNVLNNNNNKIEKKYNY